LDADPHFQLTHDDVVTASLDIPVLGLVKNVDYFFS
jgi:hypothetical protein